MSREYQRLWWTEEVPPSGCESVPIASIDVMSFSYSAKETLAKISQIMGKDELVKNWNVKALAVQEKIKTYLWNDQKGACFDRDKNHNEMPILIHNSLRIKQYFITITIKYMK